MVDINFFKKIFGPGREAASVSATELTEWLQNALQGRLKSIDARIKKNLDEFRETQILLKEKLSVLGSAKLLNEKIPPREYHLMEGNRFSYIKRVGQFTDAIKVPEPDYEKILEFAVSFEEELSDLNKASAKGYYLLKNFFDKEVSDVASDIKAMEDKVITLRAIVESDEVKTIRSLFRDIRTLNETIISNTAISSSISGHEHELLQSEEKRKRILEKADALKNGAGFKGYNDLDSRKKALIQETDSIGKDIKLKLLSVSRPLKKFKHETSYEGLVDMYYEDPVAALKADSRLNIADIISNMKEDLLSGKLEIKEVSVKKFASQLDALSREYFQDEQKRIERISLEIGTLNRDMERNSVMMNFKELEYQEDHLTKKIDTLKESLDKERKEKEGLSLEKKREELEKRINEITGAKIKILI